MATYVPSVSTGVPASTRNSLSPRLPSERIRSDHGSLLIFRQPLGCRSERYHRIVERASAFEGLAPKSCQSGIGPDPVKRQAASPSALNFERPTPIVPFLKPSCSFPHPSVPQRNSRVVSPALAQSGDMGLVTTNFACDARPHCSMCCQASATLRGAISPVRE